MRVQVNRLASLWFRGDEESAQSISQRADEKIDGYANGELNHAVEAITLLWEHSRCLDLNPSWAQDIPVSLLSLVCLNRRLLLSVDRCQASLSLPLPQTQTPSSVLFSQPSFTADIPRSQDWTPLKIALIKSIRHSVFFDRRYWTRHGNTTGALRPFHISSIVASKQLQCINGRECYALSDFGILC